MKFQGAIIKEQGVTFAVVVVKKSTLSNVVKVNEIIKSFKINVFPGIPMILMAQDSKSSPTYYGRRNISKFMAHFPIHSVPWKKSSIH